MGFFKNLLGIGTPAETGNKEEDKHKQFDVLKYDGVKAMRMGQTEYAVSCFRHALELESDLEVYDYLSQALIRMGELEQAYDCLAQMFNGQPDNVSICLRMASVAYMMENYDAEEEMAQKAIEMAPDSAEAHYLLAQSYIGHDNLILAIAMLTKSIALDDTFLSANLLRGETLLKMGDVQGAKIDAELLMSKIPDNEDILMFRARVEATMGNHAEAISIYNKVIEVNPFSAQAFKERGAIKNILGDKEGAEADGQAALELNPEQVTGVTGNYTARGTEDIQKKVEEAYRSKNPLGF